MVTGGPVPGNPAPVSRGDGFSRPAPGLLVAVKPVGVTSFEVVRGVSARLDSTPGKRLAVVHGGALDPFASGVLPVLVGPAVKLFDWLHDAPKVYRATVAWGVETDTLDLHGQPVRQGPPVDAARADEVLQGFLGWTQQVPPATSNKRVGGERAYVRAHRGEVVELPPSRVYLHRARFTAHQRNTSTLELTCRGGLYVRALVRDVARAAGTAAHLEALERTAVGPWTPGDEGRTFQGAALHPWLPRVEVEDDEWGALRREGRLVRAALGRARPGQWALPPGFPHPSSSPVRVLHQGALKALVDGQGALLVELGRGG